ncbi:Hypothetical predicted protein, partial [Cloeon dipterum]
MTFPMLENIQIEVLGEPALNSPQQSQCYGHGSSVVQDETSTLVGEEELISMDTAIEIPTESQNLLVIQHHARSKTKETAISLKINDIPSLKLSQAVEKIVEEKRLMLNTAPFVREAGLHLLQLKPFPSKADYDTYITFLLINFPQLDVPQFAPNLKRMLTKFARNFRSRGGQHVADELRQRGALVKNPAVDKELLASASQSEQAKKKRKLTKET